ncbi:MAG: hypothetical protein OEM82_00235 [Acidobacteriota bacterium]|nr:hypothetical protein [Acidobacteriota bacterium]MDH3530961.1 hypothetical protein [Acidobacteriota bacterium]
MNIAKIVSSNSHVEYIARVVDSLDAANPPKADDYGFGTFVSVGSPDGGGIVGVVFNSMLVNPEYSGYGPRLSPKPELGSFSPDFLNEQGCLLAILLLGRFAGEGEPAQGIPSPVIPAGTDVTSIPERDFLAFHTDTDGSLKLNYYSQVLLHTGSFAIPLLEKIIGMLTSTESCSDKDAGRLGVLRRSLVWQRNVGQMRL